MISTMRVLFPIDNLSSASKLVELNNVFCGKEETRFYAFFISDNENEEDDNAVAYELEKEGARLIWQAEAERLHMDLEFVNTQLSGGATMATSLFADLLMVGSSNEKAIDYIRKKNTTGSFGCAVCVANEPLQSIGEIFILVDYDPSVAIALKSFINLFLPIFKTKKITIITNSPSNEKEIAFEQSLVDFAKEYSSDVGIIPAGYGKGYKNMMKLALKANHPLLIMGRSIRELLKHQNTAQKKSEELSLYYYN